MRVLVVVLALLIAGCAAPATEPNPPALAPSSTEGPQPIPDTVQLTLHPMDSDPEIVYAGIEYRFLGFIENKGPSTFTRNLCLAVDGQSYTCQNVTLNPRSIYRDLVARVEFTAGAHEVKFENQSLPLQVREIPTEGQWSEGRFVNARLLSINQVDEGRVRASFEVLLKNGTQDVVVFAKGDRFGREELPGRTYIAPQSARHGETVRLIADYRSETVAEAGQIVLEVRKAEVAGNSYTMVAPGPGMYVHRWSS